MRKQHTSLHQQRGYLALVAVMLIVVVGFLGVAVTYMFITSSGGAVHYAESEEALFIAESGLERVTRAVMTTFLTGANARIACGAVTGNANVTNTTFNKGTFTATTVNSSPIYVNTTLSGAITNAVTTIPVTSTTGFSPAGRIIIDREIMNYGAISGNSFIAVQRGINATYSSSHASGAHVTQYQCNFDVKAGIPSVAAPIYQRELHQDIMLQEAWAVGNFTGTTFTLTRWNRPTEMVWTNSSFTNAHAVAINDISLLSNADGWAVGNVKSPNFTLLHWNGTAWGASTLAFTCNVQNLNGVSTVSSQEAWAVGTRFQTTACAFGNFRYTILHWNGTAWSALTPATTPSIPADSATNSNLNAVHVIGVAGNNTGNLGFAVGDGGFILQYNGTTWAKVISPTTQNLTGVFVVSGSEAWAIGAAGVILKWNGTTWSTFTSPTATQLNAIYMIDSNLNGTADQGWAVGNAGVAVQYNGTSWSSQNTGSAQNLFGVGSFFSGADTWAVGNAGTIMHWDGAAWTSIASNVTQNLLGLALVVPQPSPYAWQEIFP